MQRITISIADNLKQELDTITAKGERTAFITQAIKIAINERHRQQALEKMLQFKPYKIAQNSLDILAEVRKRT